MKKIILFLTTLTLPFSVQAFDSIEYVKNSIYPFDKSRTFSQVLDYRNACESTKWTTYTLRDGRQAVSYRCIFNGLDVGKEKDTVDSQNGYGELVELGEVAIYILGANGKIYHAESWQYVERERLSIKIPYYFNERTIRELGIARTKPKPKNVYEYDYHVDGLWSNDQREFYDKEGNRITPR